MRFGPGRRTRKAEPPGSGTDPARTAPTARYRLGTPMRQGLLGETFKGLTDDGSPVALTRLTPHWTVDPTGPVRLEQAAAHARDARVPGAVAVRGVLRPGDLGGGFCVVTDLVAAPTLDTLERHTGRLPVPVVLWLAQSVATVLRALAEDGRSHGALDPTTILCTASGPLLADHSLVGPLSRTARKRRHSEVTPSHPRFGTLYLAPESIVRDEWGGTASDVYALGMVLKNIVGGTPGPGGKALRSLVEECTRHQPWRRPSPQQVAHRASKGLRRTGLKPGAALAQWTSRLVRATAAGDTRFPTGGTVTTFGAARKASDATDPGDPPATDLTAPPAPDATPSGRPHPSGVLPPHPADVPQADEPQVCEPQPVGQGHGELPMTAQTPSTALVAVPVPTEDASAVVDHGVEAPPRPEDRPDVTPAPDEPVPGAELPAAVAAARADDHAVEQRQQTVTPAADPSRPPLPERGWTTDLGFLPDAPSAYARGVLYVAGTDRGEGVLRAVEGGSGAGLWELRVDGPCQAAPVPYRDGILLAARDGRLYSVGADDGRVQWSVSIDDPLGSAPAVVDDRVWLGGVDGTLQTVSLRDGSRNTVAVPGVPADVVASDVVAGQRCLWIPTVTGLHRLACDGSALWSRPDLGDLNGCGLALAGGLLFGSTPDGLVYACDAASGEVRWTCPTGGAVTGPPLAADGALYVSGSRGSEGMVAVHDAVSGHLRSVVALPTAVTTAPAPGPGMVFVATRDRCLWAVTEGSGRPLWSRRTTGRIGRCGPLAADGLVFTGSSDCHLYAVATRTGAGGPQGALRIDPEIDAALTVLFNRAD